MDFMEASQRALVDTGEIKRQLDGGTDSIAARLRGAQDTAGRVAVLTEANCISQIIGTNPAILHPATREAYGLPPTSGYAETELVLPN